MPPRDRDWLSAAFARLTVLYPSDFRSLLAEDMTHLFTRKCAEAFARGGRVHLYRFALRASFGVLVGAAAERLREGRRNPAGTRRKSRNDMSGIPSELRYAWRNLRKTPAFSVLAILTLGLGIAVNTTMFSLASTLMFTDLPLSEPDSFVFIWGVNEGASETRSMLSLPEVADLGSSIESFEGVAFAVEDSFLLTGISGFEAPRRVTSFRVTDNFFELWGVGTLLGRGFLQGEDRPGAAPVALLSHGFWERELGSDPGILGKTVRLDGKPHTVIGVVSRAMEFGDISSVELWVPIGKEIETADRGERIAFTQARLDPGATFSQAQEECDALAARLEQAYPEATGWGFRVSPMTEELLDDSDRSLLVVLFISVGLVLFIACANVANMIMARSASRAREIAVRLALGARRIAIVRQFLTEAMLLSLGGGLVGLLLARALLTVLVAITSGQNWIYRAAAIDYRVLLFTLVISMSAPLLFALLPSLKASRPDLTGGLKEGPRAGTGRVALRSRGFLVAAQLAMALSIMVVTGLLAREVIEIKTAGLGFEPEGVLTVTVELPEAKYDSPDEIRSFYRELEQGARARGAVEAALVSPVPLTSLGRRRNFRIEGKQPAEPEESPSAYFSTSGPGYFSAMSIPLLRGRDFGLGDSELSPAVALINETGARSYFAGDDPLGARIQLSGASASDSWIEIAGVVGDVGHLDQNLPLVPQIYLAFAQNPSPAMSLVVRADGEPSELAEPVRALIQSLEPAEVDVHIRTLEEIRHEVFANADAVIALFAVFAGFAFAMASMGIYGVMSYAVAQRERELGIRMALGADRGDLLRMVSLQGARLIFLGTLAGIAGAFFLSRMLSGFLLGGTLSDPATFVSVTVLLILVALFANWIPARRATRIDPISTLRAE